LPWVQPSSRILPGELIENISDRFIVGFSAPGSQAAKQWVHLRYPKLDTSRRNFLHCPRTEWAIKAGLLSAIFSLDQLPDISVLQDRGITIN
jgi:hypothetical protein